MMNNISEEQIKKYMAPYKYGQPVVKGSGKSGAFDSHAVDCPFVFQHLGQFFMLYVGFDGKGYQTALATSDDLIHWTPYAEVLNRADGVGWDDIGAAGTWIIKEDDLKGSPTLKKVNGKYWMVYHAYPGEGYEEGPAEIGLAWTEDEQLLDWKRLSQPVFSWRDGEAWEAGGLYKACIVEHEERFYMFYNAKNKDRWVWKEQIGLAVSDDLMHWEREPSNPVIQVTPQSWKQNFVADPFVVRDGSKWVLFFYGYDGRHAQEGIALSQDLINWQEYDEPILKIGSANDVDEIHAHKPSVLYYNNVLYHFYCAVRKYREGDQTQNEDMTGCYDTEFRTITVASSDQINNMNVIT